MPNELATMLRSLRTSVASYCASMLVVSNGGLHGLVICLALLLLMK
jgi:hypothetical protein